MAKANYINLVFVIDKSGSMSGSEGDVVGGFKTTIEEQKKVKDGKCTVSLFTFSTNVDVNFIGRDVSEVNEIDYKTSGLTAMNDGIGIAIDKIGEWLNGMKEEDKPSQTMFVIMTDGYENASKEYSLEKVKEMIKHQEEKYNWTFVYMGSDLTNAQDANSLGITTRAFAKKSAYLGNYDIINASISAYRCTCGDAGEKGLAFATSLSESCENATKEYANEIDLNADDLLS